MKKIFTLAIALIAFASVASAQSKVMRVNLTDGSQEDYYTTTVESVTFVDDPWEVVGTGTYTSQGIAYTARSWSVTLSHNTEHPEQYRIDDWRNEGYPLNFTLDSSDNSMFIEADCNTGGQATSSSGWTDYVLVAEANDFTSWFSSMSTVNYNSYYDGSNTYNFAIAYYMYTNTAHSSVTYWGYSGYKDYGYETLVITNSGAPAKKEAAPKSEIAEPVGVASK